MKFKNSGIINNSQEGVSILIVIMAMLILSALGMAIVSMTGMENMIAVNMLDSSRSLYIAEAGNERGLRAVRDDISAEAQTGEPAKNGFHGIPSVDASLCKGEGNVKNPDGVLEKEDKSVCSLLSPPPKGGPKKFAKKIDVSYVKVSDFQQAVNLLGGRINKVELGCRFRRTSGEGTLKTEYQTKDGSGKTTAEWDSKSWTTKYLDVTKDRTWKWETISDSSFEIKADANPKVSFYGSSPSVEYEVDYLFLRVTCEVDASTEPWYSTWRNQDETGSPKTVSLMLGKGGVTQMPVYDESEKVNINYANKTFLKSLLKICGVSGDTKTIAQKICEYRKKNMFDTIEEIKQVSGLTESDYEKIRDYITVYSWINTAVQRPTGSRAPVNVNTASQVVLEAVFTSMISQKAAAELASYIVKYRTGAPFTCMYSSDPDVKTSFAYFIDNQCPFLIELQRQKVKENADASAKYWNGNKVTSTEFCYASKVFSVVSTGTIENSSRTVKRVFEDRDEDSDGIFNIPAHTTLNCWRDLSP